MLRRGGSFREYSGLIRLQDQRNWDSEPGKYSAGPDNCYDSTKTEAGTRVPNGGQCHASEYLWPYPGPGTDTVVLWVPGYRRCSSVSAVNKTLVLVVVLVGIPKSAKRGFRTFFLLRVPKSREWTYGPMSGSRGAYHF
eukprot:3684945-Rhodomonas_salina.2